MSEKIIPFNPLERKNLGASVADALLAGVVHPLGKIPPFLGVGIYAIYYTGDFAPYRAVAEQNKGKKFQVPIYVGKAIPSGARKGGGAGDVSASRALFNRLAEHAESIELAGNLELADFHCRYLVAEDIWIPLGESLLIAKFSPLWNSLIDGFGNHDPGNGRYEGLRPRWDVLHPGRVWAAKCKERPEAAKAIARDVETFYRSTPFPKTQIVNPDRPKG